MPLPLPYHSSLMFIRLLEQGAEENIWI